MPAQLAFAANNLNINSGKVSAIAVAPGNSNIVALGTSTGEVLVSTDALSATGATAWSFTKPVDGNIAGLTFDPADTTILYATCSNFGQPHVRKSTDRGLTWTTITGSGATATSFSRISFSRTM